MAFLKSIIDGNEREVARLRRTARAVNEFEPTISALSDEELKAKTAEFRRRLEEGELLDTMLPEASPSCARPENGRSECGTSTCRSWAVRCLHEGQGRRDEDRRG